MLDQRGCRIIKAIAKEHSFSKAATSIYISQPALSRYISNLEATLGVKLFNRSTIPLTITPAGEILLQYIQKFQELDQELQEKLITTHALSCQSLRIDSLPRLAIYLLPKIIPHFANAYPMIDLQINEVERMEGIKSLKDAKADIFLTNRSYSDSHYKTEVLCADPILLVASYSPLMQKIYPGAKTSPLKPPPINWDLFRHSTMILLEPHQNMRTAAEKVCKHFAITPSKIIEVPSLPTALSLVCANKGISFICNSAVSGLTITSPLIYFSLGDIQHITDIRAIYKLSNKNPYIPIFCQIAKSLLKTI